MCFLARSIPAFSIANVLDFGYSERCAVASHCFNLHFLDNTWCGISFHMFICFPYILFLPNLCPSFTCLTALDCTFSTRLEQSDHTGHPCLVSDLSGKALNSSTLSMMVTCRVFFFVFLFFVFFFINILYQVEEVALYSWLLYKKKKISSKSSMCHNWFQQNWSWQDHP